ncbi:MAG: molybdopterin-dependent oxidoreductase [Acidobacteriota bacterium]|jgi:anaerobic selenocysteine-containing dehydrogenase
MPTFRTACPRDCYSTCTLQVTVEGGRLLGVAGDGSNRATPDGPCLKGLAYVERVHSPERLTRPLRRGRNGSFSPIPWGEACDEIAAALRAARDEYGPASVLYYAGTGSKGLLNGVGLEFWRLFGGCTTTFGDLCWPAGLEAVRLTLGENSHNAPWDLVHARLIVIWGKNPAETNIHQMPHIHQVLARGGKLVVIDPRRTETAERADLLLQLRPGSDGALALAVGHVLVRDGLLDRPFIERYVLGFEGYAALVEGWPPARAAAVCQLPASAIEELAHLVGTMHPCTIVPGFGLQRYTNSGQTMRAMLALAVITGQIGKSGGGFMYANLQTQVFSPLKDPLACYPPPGGWDGPLRVSISMARLGRDMLATREPELKVAWVERGNPVLQSPEIGVVREAFRRLDFRVVVDEFLTDTAREADIVLPAKTFLEQTDVIGAYWHPYLQLRPKVMEPPGEVLPETEIYRALGRRLGIDEAALAAAIPGPDEAAIEAWLEARLAPVGVSLEQLRRGPVLSPAFAEVAFANGRFPTPSGKIELASDEAHRRWGVAELPEFHEPEERPLGGGRYPLYLLTPNTKNRIHSQFGHLKTVRRMAPAAYVAMHPEAAAERGLVDGDRARVFNDRGELTLPVRLDGGLQPSCVCITNGFWLEEGGAVNLLSRGRETDMGHGAAFHDNAVEVERA